MGGKRSPGGDPSFRVWRHDEDEEDGRLIAESDVREAARTYADYCYRNRDGWEWSWPFVFYVRDTGTDEKHAVSVEMHMMPVFSADVARSFEGFKPAHHLIYGAVVSCDDPRLQQSVREWPEGHTAITVAEIVTIDDEEARTKAFEAITCKRCKDRGGHLIEQLVAARARKKAREAAAPIPGDS